MELYTSEVDLIEVSKMEGMFPYINMMNEKENIDIKDKMGFTPLLTAVKHKCLENTKHLLLLGADVNIKTNEGSSALDIAIKNTDIEMIEVLFMNKIDRKNYDNYLYMRYKFPDLEDFMIEDIKIYKRYYDKFFEKIV